VGDNVVGNVVGDNVTEGGPNLDEACVANLIYSNCFYDAFFYCKKHLNF